MTNFPTPTDFFRPVHCIAGLPFDAYSLGEVIHCLDVAIDQGRRCFLSTPNTNFVVMAKADADFRRSVLISDLSIPDGIPIVWLAYLIGAPLRHRVAGSSLIETLNRRRYQPIRIYLFGGPPDVGRKASFRLNRQAGGLCCVGFNEAGMGSVEELSAEKTIASINQTNPDILLVALGAKKGQRWIEHNLYTCTAPVISHLGATINFMANTLKRAPAQWQHYGFEWLWRIIQEPFLWRRYAHDGFILLGMVVKVLFLRPYTKLLQLPFNRRASLILVCHHPNNTSEIFLSGHWNKNNE